MSVNGKEVPSDAVGLRLHKFVRRAGDEEMVSCEGVRFSGGAAAVDTILRRAAISGRVEIGGEIEDHFADFLDDNGDWIETVALDAKSYRSLKNHWMRCKIERPGYDGQH